jgi:hypothetical protein
MLWRRRSGYNRVDVSRLHWHLLPLKHQHCARLRYFFNDDPVNYLLTNDLVVRTGNLAGSSQDYVASTMRDYVAACVDRWGNALHTITLTISDEDEDGSDPDIPLDDFADWQP